MVTAADGWAVGGSGKFYRYNGVSWTEFDDVGGTQFNGVDMVSATDGWATVTAVSLATGASGMDYLNVEVPDEHIGGTTGKIVGEWSPNAQG